MQLVPILPITIYIYRWAHNVVVSLIFTAAIGSGRAMILYVDFHYTSAATWQVSENHMTRVHPSHVREIVEIRTVQNSSQPLTWQHDREQIDGSYRTLNTSSSHGNNLLLRALLM